MSWFNFDEYDPEGHDFLIQAKENKGRFVKVYDDVLGRELTESEIKQIEEERDRAIIIENAPQIKLEHEKTIKVIKDPNGKTRKYKSRLPISKELRRIILELHNGICVECHNKADQIHHTDENPSNNHINNLELLCYDCHKKRHRKRIAVEITE